MRLSGKVAIITGAGSGIGRASAELFARVAETDLTFERRGRLWVGKCLMVHSNHGAFGEMDREIRWYKGPPSLAITEHWNYTDSGKDFFGGYLIASQGPLVREWGMSERLGAVKLGEETGDQHEQDEADHRQPVAEEPAAEDLPLGAGLDRHALPSGGLGRRIRASPALRRDLGPLTHDGSSGRGGRRGRRRRGSRR
jgi:hypothetical protein